MTDKEIYRLIKSNETAIKEGLLTAKRLKEIEDEIVKFLDENLKEGSLVYLRYKKFRGRLHTLWSNADGYPDKKVEQEFLQPWIDIFEQYVATKTIKKRLENDDFWVETRIQEKDEHILIGKRDGSKDKAHIIIDGDSGEIRIEKNQQAPEEIVKHIEAILTLPDGRKIRTTREGLEEIFLEENANNKSIRDYPIIEVLVESSVPDFKKCNGINILIENKSSFPLIILECTFDGVLTNHGSQKLSQGRDVFHFDSINKNNIIDGFNPEFILKVRTQAGQKFLFKSVFEIRKTGSNYELCVPGIETVEGIN